MRIRILIHTCDKFKKGIREVFFSFQGGFSKGSVSGSGTGPGDPGSRDPALPDPETFPYEWLGVRQYIPMSCVSCL